MKVSRVKNSSLLKSCPPEPGWSRSQYFKVNVRCFKWHKGKLCQITSLCNVDLGKSSIQYLAIAGDQIKNNIFICGEIVRMDFSQELPEWKSLDGT